MQGVLDADVQARHFDVTFDRVGDFLEAYRANLSHGGLFVPGPASLTAMSVISVTVRLPELGRAFELEGTVVASGPDGVGVEIDRASCQQWPALEAIGSLCGAIVDEHQEGTSGAAGVPPVALTLTSKPDNGHAHAIAFAGGYTSVGHFIRQYYSETGQSTLRVTSETDLPTAQFQLLLRPPHHTDAFSVLARVDGREDGVQVLSLASGARFRIAMDTHVRLCEAIWAMVTREYPFSDELSDAEVDDFEPMTLTNADSELVEALALLGSGFSPENRGEPLSLDPDNDLLADIPTVLMPAVKPLKAVESATKEADDSVDGDEETWLPADALSDVGVPPSVPPIRVPDPRRADLIGKLQRPQAVVDLLSQLSLGRVTGTLVIAHIGIRITVRFYEGRVGYMTEDPKRPEHRLSSMLLSQGIITPSEKEDILAYARNQSVSFFRALVDLDILSPEQALDSVVEQLRRRLLSLLDIEDGKYAFFRGSVGSGSGLALSPVAAIFDILFDDLSHRPVADMKAAEAKFLNRYVCRGEGRIDVSELDLAGSTLQLWEQSLSGRLRLSELYEESPIGGKRKTHGAIFALHKLGYIRFQTELGNEHRWAEFKVELQDRIGTVRGANYFELLDLHWSAIDTEVLAAHQKLREKYNWRRLYPNVPRDIRLLSEDLVNRLDEARAHLATRRQRQAYRSRFQKPEQIEFAADLLLRQGNAAVFRGAHREAAERYAHALELSPNLEEAQEKLKEARRRMLGLAAS